MSVAETKSAVTQQLMENLQKQAPKIAFIPDEEIVSAIRQLEEKGIPNNKHEDYKYCNIEAYIRREFKSVEQSFQNLDVQDIAAYKLDEAINLVVLNGRYSAELSEKVIAKGISIKSLNDVSGTEKDLIASQAKSSADSLIALNTVFCNNGLFFKVEKNNAIPMPVHIIYINCNDKPSLSNSRNFIHMETGSELTLIESFVHTGAGKVFSNYVSVNLLDVFGLVWWFWWVWGGGWRVLGPCAWGTG
ncbi:MAG: hypothetical protein O9353_14470 [Bacteroidia bacterium]|nr:hypothetical protein [Bacteroidia bacterium]